MAIRMHFKKYIWINSVLHTDAKKHHSSWSTLVKVMTCYPTAPSHYVDMFSAMSGKVHDDIIKWKHFPRYWPFVRGIHRPPVSSPHKGQWSRALMFSLICAWINYWVNNREADDLRRHSAHYDVFLMFSCYTHVRIRRYVSHDYMITL